MAFPYKTILCPVHFDDNALPVLIKAAEIARHFQASVILVHVVPFALSLGEAPPPWGLEAEEKAAKAKLTALAEQTLDGLKRELLIYTGDVITGILDAQEKYQADLVVMATHGRRGLARMILGSVAAAVVRKAACPVLTIREGA
ncbi:MAG TPA: universal stress protein [Candidatus Binataceae bacterium]|nr:universal stress protein [Candidatus Binataceae bacterium]